MAIVLQSRFAGLLVEDDDTPMPKTKKNRKKPAPQEAQKKMKNGTKAQNGQSKKQKSKSNGVPSEQWKQWKQKDSEMVNGNYETDMQQAMILSKMDYEEKNEVVEKPATFEPVMNKTKKQKKKCSMTLGEFNGMMTDGDEYKASPEVLEEREEPNYFQRIENEAKAERAKEQTKELLQVRSLVPDMVLNKLQFAEAIERKDEEIALLKEQLTHYQDELQKVKYRNKRLCHILGQAEMRDKAEVLVEVEKLLAVQSELTSELSELHSQLEKERSKNADGRTREKKRKNSENNNNAPPHA